ncbi:hypothetical protein BKA62DRAFT_693685 [Auriculariales sp. MPI-PUGE-AT-0066]|nr:hypothetical protein BKA62DRAFT_693685 [Auriculariales sp. MPI-PUGE-AT-0066]
MTDALEADCMELQKQEQEVLEAIWPNALTSLADGEYRLEAPVDFGAPRTVRIEHVGAGALASATLSHLPSLLLVFKLPKDYPSQAAPTLESVICAHDWLSATDLARVREEMLRLWTGDGVLDVWLEWIRGGDMLRFLMLDDGTDIVLRHPSPQILAPFLAFYDAKLTSDAFNSTAFLCGICDTSTKGARSVRLACGHVFCRACLHDYWSFSIREGSISAVGCADPACVKKHTEATQDEVRMVVETELVERWIRLVKKRQMERDPSLIHCPNTGCQQPVPRPMGSDQDDSDSGWNRFRQCSNCSYSFCAFCRRTWHGPLIACALENGAQIVLEYMALEEGSQQQKFMELKYGARNLRRLVVRYKEDMATQKYIESKVSSCPGCKVKIQKGQGCNHMTCVRCKVHFCYLCKANLDPSNPYSHFSTPNVGCYNRLFDREEVERFEMTWDELPGVEI